MGCDTGDILFFMIFFFIIFWNVVPDYLHATYLSLKAKRFTESLKSSMKSNS